LKMIRGLFFASFISIMLAMIISFLPTVEMKELMQEKNKDNVYQTVFSVSNPIYLDDRQIVPFLKQVPVFYPYKKVEIDRQVLFVDSKIINQDLKEEKVFLDAYQLIHATFMQTSNIDQFYLRFMLLREDQPALLLAVTTNRSDELLTKLSDDIKREELESFIKEFTKLDYGTGWSN
jgi:hypothetical protein